MMNEDERREARDAAETALESMTEIVVNWTLAGEEALASQALGIAEEIAQELRALEDRA